MIRIHFEESDGSTHTAEVRGGMTLMEAGVRQGIAGIEAVCGGSCACATCHVYIDPSWQDSVGPPGASEEEMLGTVSDRRKNSRLSCQIRLTEKLNGLRVQVPDSQTAGN